MLPTPITLDAFAEQLCIVLYNMTHQGAKAITGFRMELDVMIADRREVTWVVPDHGEENEYLHGVTWSRPELLGKMDHDALMGDDLTPEEMEAQLAVFRALPRRPPDLTVIPGGK